MFLFILCFSLTMAGVHWVYIPEILNDSQFGFVMTVHFANGIEIALVSEYLFQYLGTAGTFFMFSVVNLFGFLFVYFFIKETNGLTDKQKK